MPVPNHFQSNMLQRFHKMSKFFLDKWPVREIKWTKIDSKWTEVE